MRHVTAKVFRKFVNQLMRKVIGKVRAKHKVWIAPAPFRAMQFINKARYLLGDITLKVVRLNKPKDNTYRFRNIALCHR